ncbi:TPA_asm: late control protein D [Salmonella enterica subsp. enterica serovar Typhimurium]|uniref:Late control protein D n=1 Tax=Salmonella typhimurium TaxID=90371 RepID=A0A712S291_SALTM|nr:late control protein D [Salmonella enterica subsp. enterica serovar Typhimurium]HAD4152961.1 late control protein D [Salmonella enterica subsp. enterica serovar Typhimurium]HAD6025035.1 late control protein D [Salmonella enterica subsp. enterica serovar Typhimurium]
MTSSLSERLQETIATTVREFCPAYRVTAEGRDITRVLARYLVDITLTDYGGATARSDELKITLLSDTLPLPTKGARLRVALGFNGNLVDKGWFVVCGVSSSGPPRRIEIYATAAPMNAETQPGDVLNQKTRSWDNLTLGDMVKTVATENGLKARVAKKLAEIRIAHVDQVAESDASLLSRLARTYNAVSKPAGGYWLFLEQGAGTTVSGNALKTVTLTPSTVSSWNYQEGERGSSVGGNKKEKKEKITVRYFDKADGRTKTATVEHNGSSVTSPYTQPEKDTAEQQAKSKKTQAQRNSRKMTLTGPCRPSYVAMTAESGVVTSGFGKREDRRWLVESLVFSLSSSGFSFTFNLVAEIKSAGKSGKKSGDKTTPDYFGTGSGKK